MLRAAIASLLSFFALTTGPLARAQEEPPAEEDTAVASGADADIEALRELVTYARYADALTACTTLLARTDLSAAQRNAALEMHAVILIARRRLDDARGVLAGLYARDPEHRLGYRDAGPNVRDEFDRARESGVTPVAISLTDTTAMLESRTSPEITIAIGSGGEAVDDARLSYRVTGEGGEYERALMHHDALDGTAVGRVPVRSGTEAYSLDYYIEVLAPSGATLTSLGTAAEPLTLSVPAAEIVIAPNPETLIRTVEVTRGTNVAEEWWFWTIIGVVVAGGVAGAVAGGYTASLPSGPQPGSLGEGRL